MPVSKDHISRISRLARLHLSPEEVNSLTDDLTSIVTYVDRLASMDRAGDDLGKPSGRPRTARRDDEVCASLPVNEALENAPENRDNFFVVPRVI